jgi:hypothetical protein
MIKSICFPSWLAKRGLFALLCVFMLATSWVMNLADVDRQATQAVFKTVPWFFR